MRILFVNRMVNMERGGGETFDLEIAKHLQQMGCEIRFLSGIPLFSGPRISSPFSGFQVPISGFCLRSPYFGWFPWDKVRGGWRLRALDFWMFEKRAVHWALCHAKEFDVIQVCELPTFVVEWEKRAYLPVVMRLTAPNYLDSDGALIRADAVIASGMTVKKVRADVRADCEDIPNAVDTILFSPHRSSFRERKGISDDEWVIVYVARFQDFKNHALLLEAFARLLPTAGSCRLVLAGNGPLRSRIERQAQYMGLTDKVLFLGEVPYADLPDVYAASDIMAISSDFESFCFAALEAMASALPIVTTDCGWVPRLIGKEGGIVVPLRDAPALAKAMSALIIDREMRKRMGEANRKRVEAEHGWEFSAKRLLLVYERVVKNNK